MLSVVRWVRRQFFVLLGMVSGRGRAILGGGGE